MPSLMVHYGTTLLAVWPLRRPSLLTAFLLGATWPDVSWMVLRVLDIWLPDEFRTALRFYAQAFHTPLMGLWGGVIFACFVQHPWSQGIAFIGAAWFHLLLDACQRRYGNGVAFLYPASWRSYNFAWFWSEDFIGLLLLGVSIGVVLHACWKGIPPLPLRRPSWSLVLALSAGFLLMPLTTWHAALEANVHNMALVYAPSAVEGKTIGFERNRLISSEPPRLRAWYGHELILDAVPAEAMPGDVVSLRGIYRAGRLDVEQFHRHWPYLHSAPSIVALVMFVLALCRARTKGFEGIWTAFRMLHDLWRIRWNDVRGRYNVPSKRTTR